MNGSFHGRFADKDYAIARFQQHNENVRRKVPPDRLLEWSAAEGLGAEASTRSSGGCSSPGRAVR